MPVALCALLAAALPAAAEQAGDVVMVRGKAVIERSTKKIDVGIKASLQESDSVITRDRSRVKMLFRDDSVLTLGANSRLNIKKYLMSPESKRAESIYELADGKLRSVVGSPGFKVVTPTAFAAARGTVFTVSYNAETGTTEITVIEGSVEVQNVNAEVAGTQTVSAGQSTSVTGNQPPAPPQPAVPMPRDSGGLTITTPGNGSGSPGIVLTDLSPGNTSQSPPIDQQPQHAATKTSLNIVFPR
jgi:hypothetical protein